MRNFGKPPFCAVPRRIEEEPGFTLPYRNIEIKGKADNDADADENQLFSFFPNFPNVLTFRELFDKIIDNYNSYPMFGSSYKERAVEWLTYNEFGDLVKCTAAGILQRDTQQGEFFGIIIENNIYYPLAQWACAYLGVVLIPMDISMGPEIIYQMIQIFKCTSLICTAKTLKTIMMEIYPKNPPGLINKIFLFCDDKELFNITSRMTEPLNVKLGITVFPLPQLVPFSKSDLSNIEWPLISADSLCCLNVGSGRCGSLKPCYLTHMNLISAASGIPSCDYKFGRDVYVCVTPMHRVIERSMQLAVLAFGGCVAFVDGECHSLVECLLIIRPTILFLQGEKMRELSDHLVKNAMCQNCIKRLFFDFAFSIAAQAKEGKTQIPWISRTLAIDTYRETLGGRLRVVISSSCWLEPRIQHIVRTMLQIPVIQTYGVTETGGFVCIQRVGDAAVGNVGAPTVSLEIRLRDFFPGHTRVNEGDYGEILVKGPSVFKCYHKNPELTDKYLLEDGWFATGDLGKILPNGSVVIYDTIKDFQRRKKQEQS